MRIICKANDTINKLWGEGRIFPTVFRLLSYIICIKVDDGKLLHNVVTGELVLLNEEESRLLTSLPCEYSPWMDELIRKHFIVSVEYDDKKTIDTLRKAVKIIKKGNEITSYTIMPTTYCNARCFYCYEAGRKCENMSDETADKLVNYIDNHRNGKSIKISWFGGEPLVGIRQIDRISDNLRSKKIEFLSSMVSNGYLFDKEIVKRAKNKWNLRRVQITLDGTENIYNATKSYINYSGSPYQRVLNNIELLMQNNIFVSIRLNVGTHNCDDLLKLVHDLYDRYPNNKYLSIYTHALFDNCGFAQVHFDEETRKKLFDKIEIINHEISSHGMKNKNIPVLLSNKCMCDGDNSLLVVPSGKFGKCEHYSDSHFIGDLDSGITNTEELQLLREPIVFDSCAMCPLYPSCIKLRLCETDNFCAKFEQDVALNNTMKMIEYYYKSNQNGDDGNDDIGDMPTC